MKNKFAKIFLGSLILVTLLFMSVLVSAANVDWQGNQSGRGIYWVKNTSGICFNDTTCFSSASGISSSNLNRSFADTLYYNISNPQLFVNISTINGLFNYSAVISGVQTNISNLALANNTIYLVLTGIQGNDSNTSIIVAQLISNNTIINSVIIGLQGNISNSSTLISQIITNNTLLNSFISGLQSNDTKFNTSIATIISVQSGTNTNVSNIALANNTVFTLIGQMQTNISGGLIASARLTGFATECSNGSAITWSNVSSTTCKVFLRAGDNFTGTLNGSFSGLFTGTVPYDSAAAGWQNDSTQTNSSLQVNAQNVLCAGNCTWLFVNGTGIFVNSNGSTTANPRVLQFNNYSSGGAIAYVFDNANGLYNSFNGGTTLYGFHTIVIRGDTGVSAFPAVSTVSNVSLQVIGTLKDSVPLEVVGAVLQNTSFIKVKNSSGNILFEINNYTVSVFNTNVTANNIVSGNVTTNLGQRFVSTRGTNACVGNVTVVSGASGFINTTCATGDYKVFISEIIAGGTPGVAYVTKGVANFTITGIATDSSTYDWFILGIN